MANIQYSAVVGDARGAAGGVIFSRNRSGPYIRARVAPVNPQTALQEVVRAGLSLISEQWRESPVTEAMRIAWQTYASSVNAVNKLGASITLTGFNAFIAGNTLKVNHGFDFVEDGPTTLGLPAQDPSVSIALSEASGITVTFDDTFTVYDEDNAGLICQIGEPQSPSRNFFNGPWRTHGIIEGSSVTPPTSPEGPTAVTAYTLIEGQKVWTRVRILRADGRVSGPWLPAPVIVAA